MKLSKENLIKIVIALAIACLSMFIAAPKCSSTSFHANTIEALDSKKVTVMELAAASTAASAALSAMPGDATTPIAEKLADLSGSFLIVLSAIYLEKYLVTITGYASFGILIPLACFLFILNVFLKKLSIQTILYKITIFAVALFLVIPTSVKVSNMIEETYNTSIQETLEGAKDTTDKIEEESSKSNGIFSGLVNGITNITKAVETTLNNFIEAFAVMLVTSCLIPILVLLFFIWLVKIIIGIEINVPMKGIIRK